MLRVVVCCIAALGCGSTAPAPAEPPVALVAPVAAISTEEAERAEKQRRGELAAAHRDLLDEQQTALAVVCDKTATQAPAERCEPSCYRAEAPDPRAGTKHGRADIVHLVCRRDTRDESGPLVFADEIGGAKVMVRAARGPAPKTHKKGTWEAELAAEVAAALEPEVARGEVIRVTSTWKTLSHPLTKERLRCVTVAHRTVMRRALDACGARGRVACEANGNAAARGINVVHYRLAEARQLRAAGKEAECQRASLEAIAVARGMPRWRQYATLNVNQWKAYPRYRTRFDGILDEDALFAVVAALGSEAQTLHAECGGAPNPKTTAAQEQSFHTCW